MITLKITDYEAQILFNLCDAQGDAGANPFEDIGGLVGNTDKEQSAYESLMTKIMKAQKKSNDRR